MINIEELEQMQHFQNAFLQEALKVGIVLVKSKKNISVLFQCCCVKTNTMGRLKYMTEANTNCCVVITSRTTMPQFCAVHMDCSMAKPCVVLHLDVPVKVLQFETRCLCVLAERCTIKIVQ